MKFLNAELKWIGKPALPWEQAIDTLAIARKKFPGSPASLDALCRRFNIDNSSRTLHGALLDSEILAEVYLELIGGKQPNFALDTSAAQTKTALKDAGQQNWKAAPRPNKLPSRVSEKKRQLTLPLLKNLGNRQFGQNGPIKSVDRLSRLFRLTTLKLLAVKLKEIDCFQV